MKPQEDSPEVNCETVNHFRQVCIKNSNTIDVFTFKIYKYFTEYISDICNNPIFRIINTLITLFLVSS